MADDAGSVVRAGRDDGLEVVRRCVRTGHGVEGLRGLAVILGEDLGQGGVVRLRSAERADGLGIVALLEVEHAEGLAKLGHVRGAADELLRFVALATGEGQEAEVDVGGAVLLHAVGLVEEFLSLAEVAGVVALHTDVVPGAAVVGEELGGLGVDRLAVHVVRGQGGGVEQLLDVERFGVRLGQAADLLVRFADDFDVGRQA